MSTDAFRHRTRVRSAGRAEKERRERIVLVVGVVLLAGLLALEGPKTLKALEGSGSSATTSPAAAPSPASPGAPAAQQPRTVDLRALRGFPAKDPFVPQLGTGTGAGSLAPTVAITPPAVRASHFVAKDPFVQQITVGSIDAGLGATSAGGGATARGGYIVMLASVYLGRGRAAANKAAAVARAHRVPNVGIVLSSDYPTLRTGFYAVYSGPYPTLDKALTMLEEIRGRGYVSAYTRRLAR